MDRTPDQAAVDSFTVGAYAETARLLDAALTPWPAWVENDALPLPDAAEVRAVACQLLLLCAAQGRNGTAGPVRALLSGGFWDWQAQDVQQMISAALFLSPEAGEAGEQPVPVSFAAMSGDLLGQALLFELACAFLRLGLVTHSAALVAQLRGSPREVLSALIALRAEQPLSPATEDLLGSVSAHPAVSSVLGSGVRTLRLNLLSAAGFDGDVPLQFGGQGRGGEMQVMALVLLLSERVLTNDEIAEALGLSSRPAKLIMSIRKALGTDAVLSERGDSRFMLFRLNREFQVSSDVRDLHQRALNSPLLALRLICERLLTLGTTLPPVIAGMLMDALQTACAGLAPHERAEGLEVMRTVLPAAPDLRRAERLIAGLEGRSELAVS